VVDGDGGSNINGRGVLNALALGVGQLRCMGRIAIDVPHENFSLEVPFEKRIGKGRTAIHLSPVRNSSLLKSEDGNRCQPSADKSERSTSSSRGQGGGIGLARVEVGTMKVVVNGGGNGVGDG
jgi:hypothetical protein